MARLIQSTKLDLVVTLELNAAETKALHAITTYNLEDMLTLCRNQLSKNLLDFHETGIRSLFESARKQLPPVVKQFDDAEKVLKGLKRATDF